ncbi:unnamed protein product [Adineta ricciae]|uniref:Uncharacterized protein n=1 Tax=Adineta ricciae TaxID=249248 RepID=A0A815AXH8_ADIRI|nr:unnamed protein product [Adineta ricciae]CAF1261479.1 unnamed protein product [Adineta ricciae]
MGLAPCIISFVLGLLAIDMFCDHYLFVSTSLSSEQLQTCTSYYQNAFRQPWYTSLTTLAPILIGALIMLRNIVRTIYDTLSVPVFLGVVAIFILKIQKSIESISVDLQANDKTKEKYLREIADNHAIIGGLLIVLLILQILAEKRVHNLKKKQA